VVFNPRTRSAFLAVGGARGGQEVRSGNQLYAGMAHQDVLPPVIELLRNASGPDGWIVQGESQGQRLVRAGLVCELDEGVFPTYISRYQVAVHDYPFNDYSDPDWLEKDVARMRKYAELWSPPPLDSDRPGPRIPLPDPGPLGRRPQAGARVTLASLAYILRYAFGATGTVSFRFGDFHHKTSPSGGARHPAEGVVILRRSLGPVPPGAYHYLAQEHALTPCQELGALAASSGAGAEILCRLHVERAMFRYREIRSWRPVLLDIGHITETIRLLAGISGLASQRAIPRVPAGAELATLADPVIASVRLEPPWSAAGAGTPDESGDIADGAQTSPFMYLTFEEGDLVANVVHPRITRTRLGLAELGLLSYCIPSTRGDRPADAASLAERYPGITAGRVRELAAAGVLLPPAEAARAYDQTRLWSAYNWYPSLLAHLETRSAVRASEPIESEPAVAAIDGLAPGQVAAALGRRQTCRSFADTAISANDLTAIVGAAGDDRFRPITTTAVLHNVAGQAPGAVGRFDAGTFGDSGRRLTRAQVREAVIGQHPASQGALVLWLTTDVDLTRPGHYEATITGLGAVAQRLILAATQRGLAVFCTPAINDDMTFARLGLPGAGPQTITYVLTIGRAAQ
jgi:hypothetical protein